MQNLIVSIVQTSLYWEQAGANLAMLEEKIWQIGTGSDLIVLPEMFTTGFTMDAASVSEPVNLTTYKWMKQMAAQTGAVIVGSLVIKENQRYYNRLVWMRPDGSYSNYDKRHLFRMAGEDKVYAAGEKLLVEEIKGWKICPLICYDLRFPVWSRNNGNKYDLLIYVANWPAARRHAWKTLLPARAIENCSYCIGVNRIGNDGKGLEYSGDSGIWDFKGEQLQNLESEEKIQTLELKKADLVEFRERFPAWLDADNFSIEL